MNLYLVDAIEDEVDLDFRQALFVHAETPQRAAYLWEKYYEWGNAHAQVHLVDPTKNAPFAEGAIDWDQFEHTTVTL